MKAGENREPGKDLDGKVGSQAETAEPGDDARKKVILVIDDDVAILLMVKKLLEHEGLQVEVAETAMEGIAKFRRFRPSLVLLDVNLNAVETGFDVCARLKQLFGDDDQASLRSRSDDKQKFVSVVFLTARASEDDVRQASVVGGDGYIVKPFTPETLLTKVYYYLDKAARHTDKASA